MLTDLERAALILGGKKPKYVIEVRAIEVTTITNGYTYNGRPVRSVEHTGDAIILGYEDGETQSFYGHVCPMLTREV